MSSDPFAELLEEYWEALQTASTRRESQRLRDEIRERLENVASSLELLDELHEASHFLEKNEDTDGPEGCCTPKGGH